MNDDDRLPNRLAYSRYWLFSEADKFEFRESEIDDIMRWSFRKQHTESTVHWRNREIWHQCKVAGIVPSDLSSYFGMDVNHIRRILENGKAPDHLLWYALHLADIEPTLWLLTPNKCHQRGGFSRAVEVFQHHCETSGNSVAELTRSGIGPFDATRIPAPTIGATHAAFMWVLCADEGTLDEWLHLSVPIATDFCLLSDSSELRRLLTRLFEEARTLIALDDEDSIKHFDSWASQSSNPATTLGEIAAVWNPSQLYCHVVRDEIQF